MRRYSVYLLYSYSFYLLSYEHQVLTLLALLDR
jgi:hypothetical protein